jgi:hypothetical protein
MSASSRESPWNDLPTLFTADRFIPPNHLGKSFAQVFAHSLVRFFGIFSERDFRGTVIHDSPFSAEAASDALVGEIHFVQKPS